MQPIRGKVIKSNEGLDMVKQGFKVLNLPPEQKGIRHTGDGYQDSKMNLRNSNEKFEKTIQELKKSVMGLKKANKEILEQQKEVIEEERLKVLLELAGATAHELNQPLTALLGSIELMEMNKDSPEKMAQDTWHNRYSDCHWRSWRNWCHFCRCQITPDMEYRALPNHFPYFSAGFRRCIINISYCFHASSGKSEETADCQESCVNYDQCCDF